jgi:protein-L-isoaspartate(D-aspartate) O-methyltransferase
MLVEHLQSAGLITRPEVAAAFLAVPRHLFLPNLPLAEVYSDAAIPTKMQDGRAISSSSQPAMMAIMLEQLDLQPGQNVLEIGAGTGYNAALLGRLVGPAGRVVTIDLDDDIVAAAREHLAAAGSENVQVVCADGGAGYAAGAPYDRLILSVGTWDITPAWLDQLRAGGRLVLPLRLGVAAQRSVAFVRAAAGAEPRLVSQSVRDCGFMDLRGAFAGPQQFTRLGPAAGLTLVTPGPFSTSGEVYQWLMAGGQPRESGLQTAEAEVFGSLALWLDLHAAQLASLIIEDGPAPAGGWPCLFRFGRDKPTCFTFLLLAADGLAVLDGRETAAVAPDQPGQELGPFALRVVGYGPRGPELATSMLDLLHGWDAAGRPTGAGLRLRVYGRHAPLEPAAGETVLLKPWSKIVLDWPG